MKDIGIKRICVSVSELEKSLAFFTGEMELTEVCRGRLDEQTVAAVYGLESSAAEYAMLKNEEQPTLLQLICFTNTPKRPIREGRPSWDFGYYDVAFRAKDNSWAYEHFKDLGFDYYCPPTRYVADWINLDVLEGVLKGPDAMPMALIERLKEPIPRFEGMFSIFTDVAQTVASGEEAARFYEGVLGLSKVFDEELPDGLVDDIVGVPHGDAYPYADVRGGQHAHNRMSGILDKGPPDVRRGEAGERGRLCDGLRDGGPGRTAGALRRRRL